MDGRDRVLENSVPVSQREGPTGQLVNETLPKVLTQSSECTHYQGAWVLRVPGEFRLRKNWGAGQDREHPSSFHTRGD